MDFPEDAFDGLMAFFLSYCMFLYGFLFALKLILNVFKNRSSKIIQLNALSLCLWMFPWPLVYYLLEAELADESGLDILVLLYLLSLLVYQAYAFHVKLKISGQLESKSNIDL